MENVSNSTSSKRGKWFWIIGGLVAIIYAVSTVPPKEQVDPLAVEREHAWFAACDIVTHYLKAPSSAKFPNYYVKDDIARASIKRNTDKSYTIISPYEAQNSFGVFLASAFIITVRKSEGEKWITDNAPYLGD